MMKTILLLISIVFAFFALSSCTNEEGENDLDFITPDEEEQLALVDAEIESVD